MSREVRLIKNTIIYAIGNFGSKFMNFMLLPLYTYYLTRTDFGTFDIINTTIALLLPLLTLQITDAMYRNIIDEKSDDNKVLYLTNALSIILVSTTAATIIYLIIQTIQPIPFAYYSLLVFITLAQYQFFSESVRGLKLNLIYSLGGIVLTGASLLFNILLIVKYNMKVEALLISNIIGNVSAILLIIYMSKMYRYLNFSRINLNAIKNMLTYAAPLIPNTLMWWVMSLSDRYMLNHFIGIDANGLYAVSNRFPSLLVVVNSIFYLAWQESAITEYQSEDRDGYYSKVFIKMCLLLFSTVFILLAFTKFIFRNFISDEFHVAVLYIPFLYFGAIFNSFSGFLGIGYLSSRKTLGAFSTSLYGAIVKLVLAFLLIPIMGIQAAAISTMLSFGFLWAIRAFQTKKYFSITIDSKKLGFLFLMGILFTIGFFINSFLLEYIMMSFSVILFIILNMEFVKKMYKIIESKMYNKVLEREEVF